MHGIRYTRKDEALSNPEHIENGLEQELKALKRNKRKIDVVYQHDGEGRRIIETTSRESRRRRSNVQVISPGSVVNQTAFLGWRLSIEDYKRPIISNR